MPHPCRVFCDMVGIFSRPFEGSGQPKSKRPSGYQAPPAPDSRLRRLLSNVFLLAIVLAGSTATARTEPTVEELKARVSAANVGDKAKICLEIAEKQLNAANKQYTADDIEKAQTSLTDVVAFSELARDYSLQSHKHQKRTEIAIRSMTRKLNDLLHVVGREEQGPLKEAIKHLERVRDDLLAAMFPKGAK
ncbi:MAG: hypothetical protein LAP86_02760 [Acidobacteriia bacterium]|nr:hypothetical protein [Terriglobia bacterium]